MFSITLAGSNQRELLGNLSRLYIYELARYMAPRVILDNGLPNELEYLDLYWKEEDRFPFLIHDKDHVVGFALVNKFCITADAEWNLAEFFVLRPYQRKGIGSMAAKKVLEKFDGAWEIQILPTNLPATTFWEGVAVEASGGDYEKKCLFSSMHHSERTLITFRR